MDEAADCDGSDLEELEARLYSEVHHSKDDVEQQEEADQVREVHNYTTWRSAFRYFKSPSVEQPGGLVPPGTEEYTSVRYSGLMSPPNTYSKERSNVLFNNVLDNFARPDQRTYTGGILSERTISLLFPERKKKVRKPRFRQKRRGQKQQPLQETDVAIFISDESDDDCIIVQDNKEDGTSTMTKDDNDDEIIYIPPPPVEVITVDEEAQPPKINDSEANNVNSSPVDSLRKGSPNDFLENYGSENDFNFGLHGSEFRNQMESVSPNKVPYDCETESSSSTIEPGRSFNNTVKTIVFNEVDFPKGDIFAEKNLDTFESLITTRREANGASSSNVGEEQSKSGQKNDGNADDHSSSSESDYEVNDNLRTTLPHLSLMHEENLETSERKQGSDPEKVANKKKPPSKKKKKKTKTKSVDDKSTDDTKKKKKSSVTIESDVKNGADSIQNNKTTTDTPKRKKKLSINDTETVDNTMPTIETDCTPAIVPENAEVDDSVAERRKRNSLTSTDNPKKKKKSLSESLVESTELGTNVQTAKATSHSESLTEQKRDSVDNTKKKQKTSLNEPIVEETDETAKEVVVDHESSSNEVIIIERNETAFQVVDSCDSDDVDDMRDVIIVEDDLNLANCKVGQAKRSLADFDVIEIQRGQSDDPSKWEILDIDRALPMMLSLKEIGPRCKKCRHFGHYAYQCPDKPGPIPCTLCGRTNHQEPRCPEKQCRQCGQGKGTFSTSYCHVCAKYRYVNCNICHMRGHLDSSCPDLWRRYHLTTDTGPLVTPNGPILKPRDQQWCSGCARRGHLEHECNYYNREYPPTTPVVMDYRDTLFNNDRVSTNVRDIPSLLLLDIPKPNVTDEDRIVVSIPTSSNLKIQIGGEVGGPSTPIGVKKWLPTYDDLNQNYDAMHVKRVIMSHPVSAIKKLLESELAFLSDKVAFCSPRLLRDKLYRMERCKASETALKENEIVFWYRTLNMYIFGVHQFREGKLHKKFIMKVLATPITDKINTARRRALFGAYKYIFGCEKHHRFNYFYTIKRLIEKYDNAQASQ